MTLIPHLDQGYSYGSEAFRIHRLIQLIFDNMICISTCQQKPNFSVQNITPRRTSDGGHPTIFPMVHGALVRKNIPCLKVVVMLVTCNGTIQNDPMVKSDFLLAADYRDKQRLMRSKNFQNHLWSYILHSI